MAKLTSVESAIRHLENAAALLSEISLSTDIPPSALFEYTPAEQIVRALSCVKAALAGALKRGRK